MSADTQPIMRLCARYASAVMLSVCCVNAFAQRDFAPAQYLAHGYFHRALFNQRGDIVLTASGSSSTGATPVAQLWDVETGKLVRQFEGHRATIHGLCFTPDESRILTAAGNNYHVGPDDCTVRVWEVATGRQLATLEANGSYITSVGLSPDAKSILGVCRSLRAFPGNTAVLWDASTYVKRLVISDIAVHSKSIKMMETVRFSPSGTSLVGLVADGNRIRLWNATTGEVTWRIEGVPENDDLIGFGALEFSSDGKLLLSACSDHTARTWDVATGWAVRVFRGHEDKITATAFGFQENIMTASQDHTARLWNKASGRQIRRYDHPGPIRDLAVSKDGTRMATTWSTRAQDASEGIQHFASLWDTMSGREIKRFEMPPGRMTHMVFSPDGQRVLVTRKEATLLLDAVTGEVVRRFD